MTRRPSSSARLIEDAADWLTTKRSASTWWASTVASGHGFERAVADVQGDGRPLDTRSLELGQQSGGEVQPRGRGRHRSPLPGEHRLVPFAILGPVITLDVGRQRHVTDRVYRLVEGDALVTPQAHDPATEEFPFLHLAFKRAAGPAESRPRPRLELLARVHERLPAVLVETRDQQALDRTAARHPVAQQARRKHPRVVDDQQVARAEKRGQVADRRLRGRAGGSIEGEQARPVPLRRGLLRDRIIGQFEIEVGNVHRRPAPGDIGQPTGPCAERHRR